MKQAYAGKPITVGGITIIPLERMRVRQNSRHSSHSVYVSKEPIGIVVFTSKGQWALNTSGERVPVETYINEVYGLQQIMDGLQGKPE